MVPLTTAAQHNSGTTYSSICCAQHIEELVAEFGAAFLCAFAGISNPASEDLQASYIAGWSQALRKDNRLIVRAASAAQRAADYIRGKTVQEQGESPTQGHEAMAVHHA